MFYFGATFSEVFVIKILSQLFRDFLYLVTLTIILHNGMVLQVVDIGKESLIPLGNPLNDLCLKVSVDFLNLLFNSSLIERDVDVLTINLVSM